MAISPGNTVQVGHWSERLLPDIKSRLRITSDDQDAAILKTLRAVQEQIELVTGHEFEISRHVALRFQAGGLPFVDIPDLQLSTFAATDGAWPIPDPKHPEVATILQMGRFPGAFGRVAMTADALRVAGALVAGCISSGRMLDAVWSYLVRERDAKPMDEIIRGLFDPDRAVHVPIAGVGFDGWWIQLSRRLLVVTKNTPERPILLETLIEPNGDPGVLAVTEPRLIVARLTDHPVRTAYSFRLWIITDTAESDTWRLRGVSDTIHDHGIPVVSVDDESSPAEVAAQLLLAAHWYGYLSGEASAIPHALVAAFPTEVAWVRRGTNSPDSVAAATLLFERLLRPGFDPRRSAASMRRYMRRHAATIVRAHLSEKSLRHPWDELDVSERYYYRLVRRFGKPTADGRLEVSGSVTDSIRAYLATRKRRKDVRDLLLLRGFSKEAAHKWLQRHSLDDVIDARPRQEARSSTR